MLKGENLVYFAPEKWDGLWRNRQQLMSLFAEQNKVLYVERRLSARNVLPALRRGDLDPADFGHNACREVRAGLHVFRFPVWAPIISRPPAREMTRSIRSRSITQALSRLEMSNCIVWLARPDMLPILEEIPKPKCLIYHVVDEYTAYGGVNEEARLRLLERERALASRADAIIVVSRRLLETKSALNERIFLVPNGVDFESYDRACAQPGLPASLASIPEPRIGYSGLIGDRLDIDLLRHCAERNPHWSFLFFGEARLRTKQQSWNALTALDNVHYMGKYPAADVPRYLKGLQVGLLPYVQNEESDNISPLKLYDYLAVGAAVASIQIPAVLDYSEVVHIARTPSEFEATIHNALTDNDPAAVEKRREVARNNTWRSRAEQLSDIIHGFLRPTKDARITDFKAHDEALYHPPAHRPDDKRSECKQR